MQSFPINWGAVAVAALVKVAIGWIWFSPLLFLRPWKALAGVTDESMKHGMGTAMAIWIIGAFVMSFVLVHAVHYAGAQGAAQGAAVGFFNWLGFVLIVQLDDYAAEKRPFVLVAIKSGSTLVSLLVMGAILASWT